MNNGLPEPENMGEITQIAHPLLVDHAEGAAGLTEGGFVASFSVIGYYESSQLESECS